MINTHGPGDERKSEFDFPDKPTPGGYEPPEEFEEDPASRDPADPSTVPP
jgi:hypothetical protein